MPLHDYNGTGEWSAERIAARYRQYAKRLRVSSETSLEPATHSEGDTRWVYPVMHRVIDGIEAGDPACVEIGIEFIEQDAHFPFGKILKSNAARALRRARLDEKQRIRIRRRILHMLVDGQVPHEYKEYAKLLRKIGLGDLRSELERANVKNPYVARYVKYFAAEQS
jgi:hypothetical protein